MKQEKQNEKVHVLHFGPLVIVISILAVVAAIVACHLWGVQSDPWAACAVDAPMEQSHCRAVRAQEGERWLTFQTPPTSRKVRGWRLYFGGAR
jgi:hypothetical protein